jgi:Ca-activated chloride channel family protein
MPSAPSPASSPASPSHASPHTGSGGRLVAPPSVLPLAAVAIAADARGGLARVVLTQRFRNPLAQPLAVTYAFPLPEDAAVSGYAITVGDRRIVGEVDRREAARERFEEALLSGRTAALLEQDRSTLFTQDIGNVPPGAEVTVELTLDQRLLWTHEGSWEWRFPTSAAPRYLGAPGQVPDADRVTVDVSAAPLDVRASMALAVRDELAATGARIESPSHAVRREETPAATRVTLASEDGAALDRDLVVRWHVAEARAATATLDVARPCAGDPNAEAAFGVLTIVPPAGRKDAAARPVPRDLIVLLDTSGSMSGEPLDQARRVVSALIATLRDDDWLELLEFSNAPRRWKKEPVPATAPNRAAALAWLAGLRAGGGTEMRRGIIEALAPVRVESQRQVVLVSDGQLGSEAEILGEVLRRLPPSSRVHTVGVGSAVNRSLTGPVARAGRGVEVIVGLGEDGERAARRIVAATAEPLVVDLAVEGAAVVSFAPGRLPDLYAGAPALVAVKLRAGGGDVVVRGRTREGAWEARVAAPACEAGATRGAAPMAFFARESVSDLEAAVAARAPGGEDVRDLERRIERIGLDFQIATRLTSWVAVTEEPTVDPAAPTRRVRVPQNLPHGMSVDGLGLRGPALPAGSVRYASAGVAESARLHARPMMGRSSAPAAAAPPPSAKRGSFLGRVRGVFGGSAQKEKRVAPPRTLRGRVLMRKGNVLSIEVTVDEQPLEWPSLQEVRLQWADGSVEATTVVGGTRAGTLAPGDILRLLLRLSERAAAMSDPPVVVLVPCKGETLEIRLSVG